MISFVTLVCSCYRGIGLKSRKSWLQLCFQQQFSGSSHLSAFYSNDHSRICFVSLQTQVHESCDFINLLYFSLCWHSLFVSASGQIIGKVKWLLFVYKTNLSDPFVIVNMNRFENCFNLFMLNLLPYSMQRKLQISHRNSCLFYKKYCHLFSLYMFFLSCVMSSGKDPKYLLMAMLATRTPMDEQRLKTPCMTVISSPQTSWPMSPSLRSAQFAQLYSPCFLYR